MTFYNAMCVARISLHSKEVANATYHDRGCKPGPADSHKGPHGGGNQPVVIKPASQRPKVTAVIVTSVDPDDWFCGGRSITDVGLASFWLDIHIVDGTNTKDEKAAFIAATFEAMGKIRTAA